MRALLIGTMAYPRSAGRAVVSMRPAGRPIGNAASERSLCDRLQKTEPESVAVDDEGEKNDGRRATRSRRKKDTQLRLVEATAASDHGCGRPRSELNAVASGSVSGFSCL
jgi:chemotaxis response regulator CheB